MPSVCPSGALAEQKAGPASPRVQLAGAHPAVDCLDDVDDLLLVLDGPIDLVVVTRAQVDHDVLRDGMQVGA